jgi:predicted esterase
VSQDEPITESPRRGYLFCSRTSQLTRRKMFGCYLKIHVHVIMLSLTHIHLQPIDSSFTASVLVGRSFSRAKSGSPCSRKVNVIPEVSGSEPIHSYECKQYIDVEDRVHNDLNRRRVLQSAAYLSLSLSLTHSSRVDANEQSPIRRGKVFEIEDPNTFSAVVYIPPAKNGETRAQPIESFPLLVVLHGAGNNEHSAMYEFTHADGTSSSPPGDHSNLPPYLLYTHRAPPTLSENFIVVAPYVGKGRRSLYDEPRGKILSFVKWFNAWIGTQTFDDGTSVVVNRQRVSLFGFSEGSTLAVELATTCQFNGVVVASYGFTGVLPPMALERLRGIPIWVFHSVGDGVYDIRCSNQLVNGLLTYGRGHDVFDVRNTVKYTKLIPAQNTRDDLGREHVRAALVASDSDEIYAWLLSLS